MTGFIWHHMGEPHDTHPEGAGMLLAHAKVHCQEAAAVAQYEQDIMDAVSFGNAAWTLKFLLDAYMGEEVAV